MINRYLLLILLFTLNIATSTAIAESGALWSDVFPIKGTLARSSLTLPLLPDSYRLLHLNEAAMRDQLTSAKYLKTQNSGEILAKKVIQNASRPITLALPDGKTLIVQAKETQTLSPALAYKYPSIKTYNIDSAENKGIYGSLDMTDRGFHAMLFLQDGTRLFIDPRHNQNQTFYISYLDKDYHPADKKPLQCAIDKHNFKKSTLNLSQPTQQRLAPFKRIPINASHSSRQGHSLKTYRLAMAATSEYTDFHGGSIAGALSAITTTVSRINVIYQRDLAIKLELVTNTHLLISTNPSDYDNHNGTAMLAQNQKRTDAIIGTKNYDIGHVVSTGGGGIARLAATCGRNKARGVTGSAQPLNDAFDIDFVAHEIAHQLGGRHTFNSETLNCSGGNRTADLAVEPGSGSTILAYAGLCGDNDIQPNTDAAFHIKSIQEISSFINDPKLGGACGTSSELDNQTPTANAGEDYTIPANTPFELTGNGSDPDKGDIITYSWEQIDIGDASNINIDTSNNTIFRSFLPTSNPTRTFPRIESLLKGKNKSRGETLPVKARSLNFELSVRDGKGGIVSDKMTINVVDSKAFRITSHNSPQTLAAGEVTNLTWEVANTDTAPINCSSINIILSLDGGKTFNISGNPTPNDGSQNVRLPNNISDSVNARFKIKCKNNIFFDISDANIKVKAQISARSPILSSTGDNQIADPGESVRITIPLKNNEADTITNISATLSSTAQGIDIPVADSNYPDIQSENSANNLTGYQVSFSPNATCKKNFPIRLSTRYTLATDTSNFFDLNIPLGIGTQTNNSISSIPDDNRTGVNLPVTVTGFGVVSKPEINLDVDIVHSFRGDLQLELTSPQGTTIRLSSFDGRDNETTLIGNFPHDFSPEKSLSAFNGENLDGVWNLNIVDSAKNDTGIINSWSLHFKSAACGKPNVPPKASNGSLLTIESTAVTGKLRATDADGNPLTYNLISNTTKGTAVITNTRTGSFSYTPIAGQTGQDSFTYNVNDGVSTSANATIAITITPKVIINSTPLPINSSLTTTATKVITGTLKASDRDNDSLTYSLADNGKKGVAVINNPSTGAFTYTPKLGLTGKDTFSFTANDGKNISGKGTVTIIITPVSIVIDTAILDTAGIEISPYAFLYGKAKFGKQTPAKTFTITNTATHPLSITASEIVGNDAGQFAILTDTCSNQRLTSNNTCNISVSFQPTSIGSKSAQLQVTSNDPVNDTTLVFLSNHEASEEETTRRLPPILSSFKILEYSDKSIVSSMKPNTRYTIEWSISGYHSGYVSSISLHNCSGIANNTSCGANFSDTSKFLSTGNINHYSVTNGLFSNLGTQSKNHQFRHTFTTPNFTTNTPIVIRLYHLNTRDLASGNNSIPLIIPGGHKIKYYDKTGHRIKSNIAP